MQIKFWQLLLLIAFAIIVGILVSQFFQRSAITGNQALIKELHQQRKSYDSAAIVFQQKMDSFMQQATHREQRDSIQYARAQKRLQQSLKNLKLKYETIPSYTDLSKDSLRRLYSAIYGQ